MNWKYEVEGNIRYMFIDGKQLTQTCTGGQWVTTSTIPINEIKKQL